MLGREQVVLHQQDIEKPSQFNLSPELSSPELSFPELFPPELYQKYLIFEQKEEIEQQEFHRKRQKMTKRINNDFYYDDQLLVEQLLFRKVYYGYNIHSKDLVSVSVIPKIYQKYKQKFINDNIDAVRKVSSWMHPNLIQQLCILQESDLYIIVQEFHHGINGNLGQYVNNHVLNTQQILKILSQLLTVLTALWKQKLLHINLTNYKVYIDNEQNIKLGVTQFVFSQSLVNDFVQENDWWNHWSSPEELINGKIYQQSYAWRLGLMLYEMILGKSLFKENSYDESQQLIYMIGKNLNQKQLLYPKYFPEYWRNFMNRLLVLEYDRRPSLQQIFLMLQELKNNLKMSQKEHLMKKNTQMRLKLQIVDHQHIPFDLEIFLKYDWSNLRVINLRKGQIDDKVWEDFSKNSDKYPKLEAVLVGENPNLRTLRSSDLSKFKLIRRLCFTDNFESNNTSLTVLSKKCLNKYQVQHPQINISY